MPEHIFPWILGAFGVYLGFGVLFALAFLTRGVGRVDPSAAEGSWGFRVLIAPGVVALWPLLVRRWQAAADGMPIEHNAHRDRERSAQEVRP